MTSVQARQDISAQGLEDADVIALHQAGGQSCIQVFFVRGGYNFGNRAYYPSHGGEATRDQILEAFVGQFYTNKEPAPAAAAQRPGDRAGPFGRPR